MLRRPHLAAIATVAIWSIVPSTGVDGQQTGGPRDWGRRLASLDRDLPGWMAEAGVPGLSVAVVSPDSIWTRGYGVTDTSDGSPVAPGPHPLLGWLSYDQLD